MVDFDIPENTLSARQVHLDTGGYDENGRYFGRGSKAVWRVMVEDGPDEGEETFERADDIDELKTLFSKAKWDLGEAEGDPEEDTRDEYSVTEFIIDQAREYIQAQFDELSDEDIFRQFPNVTVNPFGVDEDEFKERMKAADLFFGPKFYSEYSSLVQCIEQDSETGSDLFQDFLSSRLEEGRAQFDSELADAIAIVKTELGKVSSSDEVDLVSLKSTLDKVYDFLDKYEYWGYLHEDLFEDKGADILLQDHCSLIREVFQKSTDFGSIDFCAMYIFNIDDAFSKKNPFDSDRSGYKYYPCAAALSEAVASNPVSAFLLESEVPEYVSIVDRILHKFLSEAFGNIERRGGNKYQEVVSAIKDKGLSINVSNIPMSRDFHLHGDVLSLAMLLEVMRPNLANDLSDLVNPLAWALEEGKLDAQRQSSAKI